MKIKTRLQRYVAFFVKKGLVREMAQERQELARMELPLDSFLGNFVLVTGSRKHAGLFYIDPCSIPNKDLFKADNSPSKRFFKLFFTKKRSILR
jgi:hypothetical protein